MKTTDLAGVWTLSGSLLDGPIPGRLPGCQYQDLLAAGLMDDPFFGTNEAAALDWARGDYEYARDVVLSDDDLDEDYLLLRISGVDTVGEILINDRPLGCTDNIHRTYELDIRPYARAGKNRIVIRLRSPMTYVAERQTREPIPFSIMGTKGIAHIRKVQSHFGWDWGPVLPTIGVSGAIELVAHSGPRIGEVRVTQHHGAGWVGLALTAALSGVALPAHYRVEALFAEPGGTSQKVALATNGERATGTITIDNPRLWWCNGLGEQPLYDLRLRLIEGDTVVQELKKRIGLRTLELDTARDEWGRNFRFVINGVPIFAKGANWIPSDSFIGRTTPEDLRYLLHSARETNMNMVRVWGGGYYGSDDFYDLCDEFGLLVWQDFAFACSPYPLYDPQFRESVRCEVVDNVRRLRHHPSLALWCGSNEIDMMAMLWKRHKKIHRATREFFHDILPRWVGEEDAVTPYWPGSPSSGTNRPKPNALHEGDTHLWQVWHGLMPIELFGKMPTRFCSEFGMESLPSRNAIAQFSADEDLSLFHPVMLAHQKSAGGNQKMLFYLLAKYRRPTSLDDFIYLSQIVQSETIREATEGWKRRIGRCNGALYWQLNDCWPVASWAGIDYSKTWKAVLYRSASVYRMISANLTHEGGRTAIYLVNEYPDLRTLDCEYRIMTMDGSVIHEDRREVAMEGVSSQRIWSVAAQTLVGRHRLRDVFVHIAVREAGAVVFEQSRLLVPDKKARLRTPSFHIGLRSLGEARYEIELTADTYVRYLALDVPHTVGHLSDNYMDLLPGRRCRVQVTTDGSVSVAELRSSIGLTCLNDLPHRGSPFTDFITRWRMRLDKNNVVAWILFKFF